MLTGDALFCQRKLCRQVRDAGGDYLLAVRENQPALYGDLALLFDVIAGPDELTHGVGYRLALRPPRHEALARYRVLVIDSHPLVPTAALLWAARRRVAT